VFPNHTSEFLKSKEIAYSTSSHVCRTCVTIDTYSIYKIPQEALLDNKRGMIFRQEKRKSQRQAY